MWNILRAPDGALSIAPVADAVPEGWVVEAVTANPDALKPPPETRIITRLAFRRRFTFAERVAFDGAHENEAFPANVRAAIRTMQTDLALAEEVNLDDQDVIDGVALLASFGVIAVERVAEILG